MDLNLAYILQVFSSTDSFEEEEEHNDGILLHCQLKLTLGSAESLRVVKKEMKTNTTR
jgi:hypothetical protein